VAPDRTKPLRVTRISLRAIGLPAFVVGALMACKVPWPGRVGLIVWGLQNAGLERRQEGRKPRIDIVVLDCTSGIVVPLRQNLPRVSGERGREIDTQRSPYTTLERCSASRLSNHPARHHRFTPSRSILLWSVDGRKASRFGAPLDP
jgi:hypothetical protein